MIAANNDKIFRHFEKYITVKQPLRNALTEKLHEKHFSRGELVHDARSVCTKSYFIAKGMFRVFFIKEDKEIAEYFPSEQEWCNSPRSFFTQQPDIYYIDAIEDNETYCLHVHDLVYLF